jgi:hypothetical protein
MSTTHDGQSAPAATASDASAQAQVTRPNQFRLGGGGISVTYFSPVFGPTSPKAADRLLYQDAERHLVFIGKEIRKVDVEDLGTIVSVTTVHTVDVGSTSFSLILPHVNLPGPSSTVNIETKAITTVHRALAALLGHPQVETYTVTCLTGVASNALLPVAAAPPPETAQDGVALVADPTIVKPGGSLTVTVDNGGTQTVTYGLAYTIERWDGIAWRKTNLAPTIFPQIAFITPPGKGRPQSIALPADVEPGFYRVVKSVAEDGTDRVLVLRAQFEVR